MSQHLAIIGLDEPEAQAIAEQVGMPVVAHVTLPKLLVKDGTLWMEGSRGPRLVPVSKVIFHGIFEDDLDLLAALALWGGPCLPNARAMMDCRLKLPCLVRALAHTRFGHPLRGFASAWTRFDADDERVAKWGNWHCGENKARFTGSFTSEAPAIIEHFIEGQAMRVAIIGDQAWQIHMAGNDWLKSIHHAEAHLTEIDAELLEDTETIRRAFGLEIIANDYIVTEAGTRHLLEVNHIPNVTHFPEMWTAYHEYAVQWANQAMG